MSETRTALQVLLGIEDLLRKILAREEINGRMLDQMLKGGSGQRASSNGAPTHQGGKVASDRDLDGQYGNPTIKKMPRKWGGDSFDGYHFSETTPEFLDVLADDLDGLAEWLRGKGEPDKAKYKELDAARARGWAQRLRNGHRPAARPAEDDEGPSL